MTGSFPVRISRPEPFGRGRKEARFRFLFRFPARIIAVSFAMVILIGTFLLMLPASSRDGSWTPLLDCLFTATSATCVTGLVIYDTYTHWTGFGQCVILLLIQTGGLGLVTMTSFFSMAVGRRLERRNLDLARESIGTQEFTIRPLLRLVVGGALAAEGVGALLLMIALVPQYGAQGIFFSIFTAVSAFCNAGFDLFGGQGLFSSLTNYNGNPLIMGTVSALIIAGGLGFVVYYDLFQYRRTRTLLLHTRVVLAATGILLLSGMLMTLACEWTNPATLGALPNNAQRLGAAWFYSVTCRTAGFNSFPCDLMRGSTKVLSALFMFIGAAPSSTGGGIKCTTAVVLAATVCSVARGDEEVVVFRRRLDHGTVYKSLAVVLMGLSAVAMSAACVMLTDGAAEISGIDAFYESVSAFATVGISVGVTGAASPVSRGLLILLMYMGRLGPVSFLLSLAMRREPSSRRVLPEGQIGI